MTLLLPKVPQDAPDELRLYLQNLTKALTDFSKNTVTLERAVSSVLLASPNGSVYAVAVDDTGTVTTTQLSG